MKCYIDDQRYEWADSIFVRLILVYFNDDVPVLMYRPSIHKYMQFEVDPACRKSLARYTRPMLIEESSLYLIPGLHRNFTQRHIWIEYSSLIGNVIY